MSGWLYNVDPLFGISVQGPRLWLGSRGLGDLTWLEEGCWGTLGRLGGVERRLRAPLSTKEIELSIKLLVSPACDISRSLVLD